MTKERSIAFVTGTGDLLNLYMYLDKFRDDTIKEWLHIVLLGTRANITVRHLTSCETFVAEHFSDSQLVYIESDTKDYIHQVFKQLQLSLASEFKELFIFHAFGKIETRIATIINAQKTVLLENGIATYNPPKGRLSKSPQIAVNEAWLPLAPILGSPYYLKEDVVKTPSTEGYQETAKKLSQDKKLIGGYDVFVIGTSLYRLGIVTLEEEINAYSSYIESLVSNNNIEKIVWKPHPRMQSSELNFFADYKKVSVINDDMPIELVFALKHPKRAFSASIASSALLSGWVYFGITPNILEASLSGLERFPHITRIRKVVQRLANQQ